MLGSHDADVALLVARLRDLAEADFARRFASRSTDNTALPSEPLHVLGQSGGRPRSVAAGLCCDVGPDLLAEAE
ncbi:MAG TPA: hypothetical protein VG346_09945 [Acidimicrobiales bacterium]|nr:hypothetical protein [Acidimicrobiales bacterium]